MLASGLHTLLTATVVRRRRVCRRCVVASTQYPARLLFFVFRGASHAPFGAVRTTKDATGWVGTRWIGTSSRSSPTEDSTAFFLAVLSQSHECRLTVATSEPLPPPLLNGTRPTVRARLPSRSGMGVAGNIVPGSESLTDAFLYLRFRCGSVAQADGDAMGQFAVT